jgi:hypothetical protein
MSKQPDLQDSLERLQQGYHFMAWRGGFRAFPFSRTPVEQPPSKLAFAIGLILSCVALLYPALTALELVDALSQQHPIGPEFVVKGFFSILAVMICIGLIVHTWRKQFSRPNKTQSE